jgi:hypothetical protein
MRLEPSPGRHRPAVALVVCSTLFPLVGVLELGWAAGPVLAFYWVEFGVVAFWSALEALFAEKRSQGPTHRLPLSHLAGKRGGVSLWADGPPAYPRNVPYTLSTLGVMAAVWLVLGGGLAASGFGAELPLGSLALGTVAVVVGRAVEFRSAFLGEAEYREVSARMVVATPARQLLALFVLGAVLGAVESTRARGVAAVALVVAGKVGYELYAYRAHHTDGEGRLDAVLDRVFGPRDTALARDPVETPDGDPTAAVRTDRGAVLAGSAFLGALTLLAHYQVLAALLAAVVLAALGWGVPGLVLVGGVVLVALSVALVGITASYLLLDGWLEYRRYDDTLVAYDRLLGTPQWRVERATLHDASVDRSVANRLAGAGTLGLRARDGDGERRSVTVGPFTDLSAAAASLDLPSYDPPPDPDRAVAYAAFGIAGSLLSVFALMYVSGAASAGKTVGVAFLLLPMMAVTVGSLLWVGLLNW